MKRYIDEKTGKIVTVINNAEAIQILDMYFEHNFGSNKMNEQRMKFLSYLSAYMKVASEDEINKIVVHLEEKKSQVDASNQDAVKKYNSLVKLFKLYEDLNSPLIDIVRAYQVISALETTRIKIDSAKKSNENLSAKEVMLSELMNHGFEFKSYGEQICKKWEETIEDRLKKGEVEISLEEEMAYQDLLAYDIKPATKPSKVVPKLETEIKTEVKPEIKPEIKKEEIIETPKVEVEAKKVEEKVETPKIEVNIEKKVVPQKEQVVEVTPKVEVESKKPEVVVETPKVEVKVEEKPEENTVVVTPKIEVKKEVQPTQVSSKTQDVDLNESLDFVNGIIDSKKLSNNNTSDDNDDEPSGNFTNIFRD